VGQAEQEVDGMKWFRFHDIDLGKGWDLYIW